jgi:hypothetical protein
MCLKGIDRFYLNLFCSKLGKGVTTYKTGFQSNFGMHPT